MCLIKETSKMCSNGGIPGLGLGTTDLQNWKRGHQKSQNHVWAARKLMPLIELCHNDSRICLCSDCHLSFFYITIFRAWWRSDDALCPKLYIDVIISFWSQGGNGVEKPGHLSGLLQPAACQNTNGLYDSERVAADALTQGYWQISTSQVIPGHSAPKHPQNIYY